LETPEVVPDETQNDEEVPQTIANQEYRRLFTLLGLGWSLTNIGYAVFGLPWRFLLKDGLHLNAEALSRFMGIGHFTNYIKPVAGILTDCVPLFGYRRRSYLLISLIGAAIGYMLLAFIPRTYNTLLVVYTINYMNVVFISTTLGGVMVEVGARFRAAGRLTAQRIGSFRVGSLFGELFGGYLAKYPIWIASGITSGCHILLIPLFWVWLYEPPVQGGIDRTAMYHARDQFIGLFRNKTLLRAALMIFLIAAAPGFGTPIFFYQTNVLKFKPEFLGMLGVLGSLGGIAGAWFYFHLCRRMNLKYILIWSIVQHAVGTLFYIIYKDATSAILITILEGVTITLATLPVYDLATRGTPKGSEALGYSVMMSVWNLTNALSDWTGSVLFGVLKNAFVPLVCLNAATTLIALLAIPFLPKDLLQQTDGAKKA
jgi:predicted MFS family arabinose efflux permease